MKRTNDALLAAVVCLGPLLAVSIGAPMISSPENGYGTYGSTAEFDSTIVGNTGYDVTVGVWDVGEEVYASTKNGTLAGMPGRVTVTFNSAGAQWNMDNPPGPPLTNSLVQAWYQGTPNDKATNAGNIAQSP